MWNVQFGLLSLLAIMFTGRDKHRHHSAKNSRFSGFFSPPPHPSDLLANMIKSATLQGILNLRQYSSMPSTVTNEPPTGKSEHFGDLVDILQCCQESPEEMDQRHVTQRGLQWPDRISCGLFTVLDRRHPVHTVSALNGLSQQLINNKNLIKQECNNMPATTKEKTTYASVLKKPKACSQSTSNNGTVENNRKSTENIKMEKPLGGKNNCSRSEQKVSADIYHCLGLRQFPSEVSKKVDESETAITSNCETVRRRFQNKLDFLRDLVSSSPKVITEDKSKGIITSRNGTNLRLHSGKDNVCNNKVSDGNNFSEEETWSVTKEPVAHSCTNGLISFIMGIGMSEAGDNELSDVDDFSDWDDSECEEEDSSDEFCFILQINELNAGLPSDQRDGKTSSGFGFHYCTDEELADANMRWEKGYAESNSLQKSSHLNKVTFPPDDLLHEVHIIPSECRKGLWEDLARDRFRFQKRIRETELVLDAILKPEFRQKIYQTRIASNAEFK